MLCADQTVIITRLVYDGETDTEKEVTTTLGGVSIYEGLVATPGSGGVTSKDLVKIRVPYDLLEGVVLEIGSKITVNGRPMTILRVHDNTKRRFSPHWYLEAE